MFSLKCISCGRNTTNYTVFPCPGCGKEKIARCRDCRRDVTAYKCLACGQDGP
ncbi:RNA-binding protein [Candidatus Micrarchaeota archaeon CG08_land_8_20_14_0_20_49_17]|nr:MAG: RNA-binding protein [Candidatus Micrarchaeota archaeon CG08_land_8_20_14_0_20_49_17]PIU82444.1 MAG: RNA-binding protein [Candidatus Micrarchaeota archaeon CG06_land_8_20_14_3_00_50_6]PIZ98214.1 MAG: RNA-binding protein [Candidatus Micrarchaeota archaeon CG_4_10_14_0_2_um_filter_49_7]HII53395.1 RNA-binding protein [Candidatus Micrarchaeota archaeon]